MAIIVDCYYCQCPVEFDEAGLIERFGMTLAECGHYKLALICNLCADMMEVDGAKVEVMNETEFQRYIELKKEADADNRPPNP